jgi:succinate-semialdehyde dehydrogenase/glutarate-semialdehyde dehydrogenase
MSFPVIDPSTGATLREIPETSPEAVSRVLSSADTAFRRWRRSEFSERTALLERAATLVRRRVDAWADLMAEEMGKPLPQGRSEAEKCAWVCEHYAEEGPKALGPERVETDATRSTIRFEPLGVVLAIMPWNFPFWQVFRFAAPALMAGNAVVLKHARNVPGCAEAVVRLFEAAGAPEGLLQGVFLDDDAAEALIDRREIRAVTLTGSTRAGRAVAARAGAALKKTVLELGGSDPYLILADADLDLAVSACVTSRMNNAGQSCIAAKRLIVVDVRKEELEARLLEALRSVKVGDPRTPETQVGPLAREDLRRALHRQVAGSVESGARLLLGGEIPEGPGWFYPPTLLTEVGPGMPAYGEELFGPVVAIVPVRDETEAIRVANESDFGLGGGVFTSDVARGERIAGAELEAGFVAVNDFVRSDPRLPFGGIKDSGYGRELGTFGIREFVNVKTVWVR